MDIVEVALTYVSHCGSSGRRNKNPPPALLQYIPLIFMNVVCVLN